MKTMLVLLLGVGVIGAAGQVAPPSGNDIPESQELRYLNFNDPAWWDYMARSDANVPRIALGQTAYVVRGPIIENIRPRPAVPNENLLDRMTRVPLIGLFVPQPMPTPPPERRRYFAWGQSDVPWSTLGDRSGPPIPALVSFSK